MQSGLINKIAITPANAADTQGFKRMKLKDLDKDRWLTGVSSPYERVFSGRDRRMKYHGVCKNQFRVFGRAIAFNLKRLVTLNAHEKELCLA